MASKKRRIGGVTVPITDSREDQRWHKRLRALKRKRDLRSLAQTLRTAANEAYDRDGVR